MIRAATLDRYRSLSPEVKRLAVKLSSIAHVERALVEIEEFEQACFNVAWETVQEVTDPRTHLKVAKQKLYHDLRGAGTLLRDIKQRQRTRRAGVYVCDAWDRHHVPLPQGKPGVHRQAQPLDEERDIADEMSYFEMVEAIHQHIAHLHQELFLSLQGRSCLEIADALQIALDALPANRANTVSKRLATQRKRVRVFIEEEYPDVVAMLVTQ